jgi:serine/threonine-protein kinase
MNNSDPLVGHLLDGRYEILRKLARGGMATVYLATDRRLTRTVAVKVMHDNLGSDQDFANRFDREARAAARLSHPNVVSVFDQGNDNGRPYMVMEYVEGSTLRNLIAREAPMEPQRALDLLIPVVSAVAAAHEAGIIHRDLKPENVLISVRGQIKVADFGLARAVTAHTATANGMLIGTVSYIAPELVTHGHSDTRCDVYALGVMMFEMLTGRKPHTGDTPIQVAYSHVHNEITLPSISAPAQWRDTRSAVPPYLDALVLAAAARQPADRPMDGKVLLDHLRQARDAIGHGVMNDPQLTSRMRETTLDDANQVTEMVPAINAAGAQVQRTATLRFTPSTPISPNHPGAADGMAYYDDVQHSPSPAAIPLQRRQARKRRRGGISLLVLIVVAAVLGLGSWYLLSGQFTNTPDFTNQTRTQAEQLATKNGLQLAWNEDFSETVPVGQVIRTDPGTGDRVRRGGTVTAFLSKGPERYPVPSLAGRSPEDATNALEAAHLKAGKQIEVFHETRPVGTVVSGSIDAGQPVKPGTVVDLNVSKGPAPVKIISFKDKPFVDAEAFYKNAGLIVQRAEDKYDGKIVAGNVISSNPKTGSSVPRNGTITFTVSKGPEMIAIPGVRGVNSETAKKQLTDLGFKVEVKRVSPFGSTAWGTNPGEGQQAPKGSTITLYIG